MSRLARYGIFQGRLGDVVLSEVTGKRMVIMQTFGDGSQHLTEIPAGMTVHDYGRTFSGTLFSDEDCQ